MASPQASSDDVESLTTMVVSAVVIVLAIACVGLRFYTRVFTKAGLGYDDWLILIGVAMTMVLMVLLLSGTIIDPNGLQVTQNTDPNYPYTPEDVLYMKYSYSAAVIYFTATSFTKAGILFMYHRIFARSTAFRYQLFTIGGLVGCWWVICTTLAITNCIPIGFTPELILVDPKYCRNFNIFWMAAGACEIFIDTLVLILPVGAVLRMHLSLRQKLTVSGIFLLGSFVIITGIIKTTLGYQPGRRVPSYSRTEVWAAVHICMATICACLPIFKPLINRIARSSLIARAYSLLSSHLRTETRQSEHSFVVDGRGSESRSGNWNGYGGHPGMELGPGSLDSLQQPNVAHVVSPPEHFAGWQISEGIFYNNGQPYNIRHSPIDTAESIMTVQLASYLENGTGSSDTDLFSDTRQEGYR
ncbi:hypothetical protein F4776DRAFT_657370 [Hypoxylon sp. NC0597]|nr:hypothetical protein F4776DRAFT_657370 [Hypoxylon sp. NC0597]